MIALIQMQICEGILTLIGVDTKAEVEHTPVEDIVILCTQIIILLESLL